MQLERGGKLRFVRNAGDGRSQRQAIAVGRWLAAIVVWGIAAVAGAHDTNAKPTAMVTVTPQQAGVSVNAHIPIVALTDVNWPRDSDGSLTSSALADPLALVARDFAAGLELREGDNPLPSPVSRATVNPDAVSVDIVLDYMLPARRGPLSARLRAWPAQPVPVPTVVGFVAAPGQVRQVIVDGDAQRVSFEPAVADAATDFLGRGARELLRGWEALFFALCLGCVIPAQSFLRKAALWWFVAQGTATLLSGSGLLPQALSQSVPLLSAFSASVVVIAALLGLLQGAPWMVPLAAAFGAAQGLILGEAFTHLRGFAGEHATVALVMFALAVLLGYTWILALVGAVAAWLRGRGLAARLVGGVACVIALHNALHLADAPTAAADDATVGAHAVVIMLTVLWIAVAIVAGRTTGRGISASSGGEAVS